jgi:hypothetical protein
MTRTNVDQNHTTEENAVGTTFIFLFLRMLQLAAIMFSDMSGYTALMQQNEQLAKDKRRRLKDVKLVEYT